MIMRLLKIMVLNKIVNSECDQIKKKIIIKCFYEYGIVCINSFGALLYNFIKLKVSVMKPFLSFKF